MTLSQQISRIVKGVCTTLRDNEVNQIVEHLVSIGLESLKDLEDVTSEMLPQEIPLLKKSQLIKAFAKASASSEAPGPSQLSGSLGESSAVDVSRPVGSSSSSTVLRRVENIMEDRSFFSFTVPWAQMPKDTMANLLKARDNKIKANPKDIDELKLAIAKKLKSSYESHRDVYPGQQKYPGRKVYQKVVDQVEAKLGDSIKTTIKGQIIQSGTSNFFKAFETCIENLMRSSGTRFSQSKVMRGKKVVGVDPDSYQPHFTETQREEQMGLKIHMQNLYKTPKDAWDWPKLMEDVRKTYDLQRDEIILATSEIMVDDNADKDENEEMIDDLENVKAIERIKNEWPLLFELAGMEEHHKMLTKRNLGRKIVLFIEEYLDLVSMFLVTSSKTNVENLIIRVKVEKANDPVQPEIKFMMVLNMLANHFGENFSSLFVAAEKTSLPSAFSWTALQHRKGPCVVALDNDIYAAKTYFSCADKVALVKADNPKDAFVAMIQICFIFDLEYPDQCLHTLEFVERYIFEMGVLDTKVKRKGKQIVVLSDTVKKFIEKFEEFVKTMRENGVA